MEEIDCDVLVIGAGLAGLYAALRSAHHGRRVVLATKATLESSNSYWAQGGIAAAVALDDDPDQHAADTLAAGDGLCDPAAVRVLCEDGVRRLYDLEAYGVVWDREPDGSLALGLEGAHHRRRVLHVGGSASGRGLATPLIARVLTDPGVVVTEYATVTRLIAAEGCCGGALGFVDGRPLAITAGRTILASGGACALYARTTNPPGAVGDGVALAFEAGARVADLEFIQFHPTALADGGGQPFLMTEALRGDGALLVDDTGTRFMDGQHPQAELAPRDVVARAIDTQLRDGRTVYLDLTPIDPARLGERFANIAAALAERGIDPARVPVAPAAHYMMGGVATGLDAETTVEGLYACGEVACTGVHGANRLASNSLLECFVFAHRAADHASFADPIALAPSSEAPAVEETPRAVREILWRDVGLVRDAASLDRALADLPDGRAGLVARLIATMATNRRESRGGHYRRDFPERDPALAQRAFLP